MFSRLALPRRRVDGTTPRFTVLDRHGRTIRVSTRQRSLDVRSADRWGRELLELAGEGRHVALDMSEVRVVDSAGLGAIVAAAASLRDNGGDLSLYACTPDVRTLLELVRLHQLLDIYNTAGEFLLASDLPAEVAG